MTIRDGLTALAEGARSYADPDAAVRTVRRRRTAGLVAAPVLVLVAVAALLIVPGWGLRGTRAPEDASGRTDLTAAGAASVLPVDRAVGPAAFAYTAQGRTWLVTRDGHRYELPSASPDGGTSLSPDGRWLVLNGLLRDLTGRQRHILQGQRVIAWSPGSTWILVEDSLQQQLLVETATGGVTVVLSYPGLAVLDDGSVVAGEGGDGDDPGPPNIVKLGVLNPRDGAEQREVVVDARSALSGREAVKGRQGIVRMWLGPDDQALFEVAGGSPPGQCALLASLRAGQRVSAVPAVSGDRRWRPLGFVGDAVLIKSEVADREPVELLAWRDGASTPLYELPPGSAVLPPGGAQAS